MPIQALDRIVQPEFGGDSACRRKRVVDTAGPALFLKRHEDHFLIWRAPLESLDDLPADAEDAEPRGPIVVRIDRPGRCMGRHRTNGKCRDRWSWRSHVGPQHGSERNKIRRRGHRPIGQVQPRFLGQGLLPGLGSRVAVLGHPLFTNPSRKCVAASVTESPFYEFWLKLQALFQETPSPARISKADRQTALSRMGLWVELGS